MSNRNETNRDEGAARELGGKLKKGLGKLIGDGQLEAEGRMREAQGAVQKEEAKASERGGGALQELGGAIKNRVGQLVGDDKLAAEGKLAEIKGQERQARNR